MEDDNYNEEFQKMLGEYFAGRGPMPEIPKAAPKTSADPIDRLNHSLEDAGLGCFVSEERYAG